MSSYGPGHVVLLLRTCHLTAQDMSSYRPPEALVTVGPGHTAAHDRGGQGETLAEQGTIIHVLPSLPSSLPS